MAKTLIAKISNLGQYNVANKTVLYEDPTESRWANVYVQLQINDNAIFIAKRKILVASQNGDLSSNSAG